jgi:hypothetical protein
MTERERNLSGKSIPTEYALKLRFLRDERWVATVILTLLTKAELYQDGEFVLDKNVSVLSLTSFMNDARKNKPTIENLLDVEVRKNDMQSVSQLSTILSLIGLELKKVGKTKAKAVTGGKAVYIYQLDAHSLHSVKRIVERRKELRGWKFVDHKYGFANVDN